MNNVYVVVSVKNGAELDVCEVYSDLQVALGRAGALAHYAAVHHPEWLKGPTAQGLKDDYTRRWVYLDNYHNYVAVHYKKVHEPNQPKVDDPLDQLKNFSSSAAPRTQHMSLDDLRAVVFNMPQHTTDFQWAQDHYEKCAICKRLVDQERKENPLYDFYKDNAVSTALPHPSTPYVPPPPPVVDDPLDHSLPAGWSYAGKPMTIGDVINSPDSISHTWHLSEVQKWALVTSRVSKRPAYTVYLPGMGISDQTAALNALKNKTNMGEEIVLLECATLDRFFTLQRVTDEEESSSSEESDLDS